MKISYTIDILRPPEEVFLWIGSPEKAMVWMTSVSKTEFLHRPPRHDWNDLSRGGGG
jgi:hypothetical protein